MTALTTTGVRRRPAPGTFRSALSHHEFRWYMSHHALTSIAKSLGTVAVAKSLYADTGSTAWVAAAASSRLLPYLFFSSLAGVIADRVNRHRLLLLSTVSQTVSLLALAVGVASQAAPLVLVALVALSTTLSTPGYPTLAAIVPRVVPAQDLAPANGIFNTIETTAWMIGPAAGGLLLLVGEPSLALVINTLMMALGACCLLLVRHPITTGSDAGGQDSMGHALIVGLRAIVGSVDVAVPLLLVIAVNVVFGGAAVGLLLVAEELLDSGEAGFGLLHASLGAGGFVGVLFTNRVAASTRPILGLSLWTLISGIPFALLAVADGLPFAMALMLVAGMGSVVTEVVAMTLMLRSLPSTVVARVFGITDSLLVGAILLGSLLAPVIVEVAGLRASLVVVGAVVPGTAILGGHTWLRLADRGRRRQAALAARLTPLAAQPWLAEALPSALERLASVSAVEKVPPGTTIIRQGDEPDDFFVLLLGEVDVTRRDPDGADVLLNRLHANQGFGEIGLLGQVRRMATVTATTPVEVLRVRGDLFVEAVSAVPAAADGSVGAGLVARIAAGFVDDIDQEDDGDNVEASDD